MTEATTPSVDSLLTATGTPEPAIRALVSGHLRIAALIHGVRAAVESLTSAIDREEDKVIQAALMNAAARSLLPALSAVLSDDVAQANADEIALIEGLEELLDGEVVDE